MASSSMHPNYEAHTENQAKVVNHIKGLLSDIVTNTIVDGDIKDNMFAIDMQPESEGKKGKDEGVQMMKNTPTILQTMFK